MAGQYDHLIGELTPGATGWLPLDDAGTPSGPATLQPPPGPNAKACSVLASPQDEIDNGADALVTLTGAPITDHMESNVDRRAPGGQAPPQTPVVNSLTPASCAIGDADFTLVVNGQFFTAESVIHFAGQDEPTTFTDASHISTGVKPSLWGAPVVVKCSVKNGSATSNEVDFEFTDASGARSRRK